MSLFDEVEKQVANLSADDVRAELAKMLAADAKRKEKQAEYNQKPENKEKRQAYSKEYNAKIEANPELKAKKVEQRKAYMSKPEVKERQKAYRQKRDAEMKALKARAAELGIDLKALAAEVVANQPSA